MNVKAKIKVRGPIQVQVQVEVQIGRGEVEVEGEVEDEDEGEDEDKGVDSAGEFQESRSGHREAVIILIRGSARTALSRPGKEMRYESLCTYSGFRLPHSPLIFPPTRTLKCHVIRYMIITSSFKTLTQCGNAEMQKCRNAVIQPGPEEPVLREIENTPRVDIRAVYPWNLFLSLSFFFKGGQPQSFRSIQHQWPPASEEVYLEPKTLNPCLTVALDAKDVAEV